MINIDFAEKYVIAIVETADAIKEALKKRNLCIKNSKIVPIEPKFKVGDWIVYCGKTSQITNVLSGGYCDDSNRYIAKHHEDKIHLWTIQDAKKGDVLHNNFNMTFIFQNINKFGAVESNFGIFNYDGRVFYNAHNNNCCGYISVVNFRPATQDEKKALYRAKKKTTKQS